MKENLVSINVILQEIFSGFSFRGKVEHEADGDLSVIQMKDLENNYASIGSGLTRVHGSRISSKLFLKHGDVLFIAKGSNNYAILYDLNLPMAIASSAFFVLRPNRQMVVPAYLAWYINQPLVQQYLKGNMAGTYIPNINKGTVEGMMISLPPVDTQQKIVLIDNLRRQEQALMSQIIKKREAAVSAALMEIVNNNRD